MAFIDKYEDVVYKPFFFPPREVGDKWFHVYTNRVTREHLSESGAALRLAPCQFQKYIPKRVELRVTVVGDVFFVAELDTQKSTRSALDWRRYDFVNVKYRKSVLPPYVEELLRKLMKDLGLSFGCIDLIVTPDDEYVFLEVNQCGQWYWIEEMTGLPILEAMVNRLTSVVP